MKQFFLFFCTMQWLQLCGMQKYSEREQVETISAFCLNKPTDRHCIIFISMLPEIKEYLVTTAPIPNKQREQFIMIFSYATKYLPLAHKQEIDAIRDMLGLENFADSRRTSLYDEIQLHCPFSIRYVRFALCCSVVFLAGIGLAHLLGKIS